MVQLYVCNAGATSDGFAHKLALELKYNEVKAANTDVWFEEDGTISLAFYYANIFNEKDKAIYWYESLGSYKPEYVGNALGRLYLEKGLFDKAARAFCQAHISGNKNGPSRYLTDLYLGRGQYIEAMVWATIHKEQLIPNSYAWNESNNKLSEIEQNMSQKDIVKAQKLAKSKNPCSFSNL